MIIIFLTTRTCAKRNFTTNIERKRKEHATLNPKLHSSVVKQESAQLSVARNIMKGQPQIRD